jgi:hypothetical protein
MFAPMFRRLLLDYALQPKPIAVLSYLVAIGVAVGGAFVLRTLADTWPLSQWLLLVVTVLAVLFALGVALDRSGHRKP